MGIVNDFIVTSLKNDGKEDVLTKDNLMVIDQWDKAFNLLFMEAVKNNVVNPLNYLHPYRSRYVLDFKGKDIVFRDKGWIDHNDNTNGKIFTIKTELKDNIVTISVYKDWIVNRYWLCDLDGIETDKIFD